MPSMPKTDMDIMRYEEYLRAKWQCSEAMPRSFDPEKLEIVRKNRVGAYASVDGSGQVGRTPLVSEATRSENINGTVLEKQPFIEDEYSRHGAVSAVSVSTNASVTESPDPGEQLGGYGSKEATVDDASIEDITRVRPRSNAVRGVTNSVSEPIEQKHHPRIRAGSKPPLSRSAFVRGGQPCLNESSTGLDGSAPIVYPRAPRYFPFKSRAGKR